MNGSCHSIVQARVDIVVITFRLKTMNNNGDIDRSGFFFLQHFEHSNSFKTHTYIRTSWTFEFAV